MLFETCYRRARFLARGVDLARNRRADGVSYQRPESRVARVTSGSIVRTTSEPRRPRPPPVSSPRGGLRRGFDGMREGRPSVAPPRIAAARSSPGGERGCPPRRERLGGVPGGAGAIRTSRRATTSTDRCVASRGGISHLMGCAEVRPSVAPRVAPARLSPWGGGRPPRRERRGASGGAGSSRTSRRAVSTDPASRGGRTGVASRGGIAC